MDYKQREKKLLVLATAITDGDLNNVDLTCPVCNRYEVVFSFTKIHCADMYGLFIECIFCKYKHHYSFIAKPKNFKDELVLQKYQELEDQVSKSI